MKYAEAPCTVLAVKDGLLGHNSLAAVYTIGQLLSVPERGETAEMSISKRPAGIVRMERKTKNHCERHVICGR